MNCLSRRPYPGIFIAILIVLVRTPVGAQRARPTEPSTGQEPLRIAGWSSNTSHGGGPPCIATLGSMKRRSIHAAPTVACGQSTKSTDLGEEQVVP